jgi:hypothetical protein
MTNSQQITATHAAGTEGSMERWTDDQSVTIHQLMNERLAEAEAERLAHVATADEACDDETQDTIRQRLGRGLIAFGSFLASEPRPATDRR